MALEALFRFQDDTFWNPVVLSPFHIGKIWGYPLPPPHETCECCPSAHHQVDWNSISALCHPMIKVVHGEHWGYLQWQKNPSSGKLLMINKQYITKKSKWKPGVCKLQWNFLAISMANQWLSSPGVGGGRLPFLTAGKVQVLFTLSLVFPLRYPKMCYSEYRVL